MAHLVNFKPRFAPLVEAGKKRQTMRPPRKRPIHPGDTLRFYSGLRTKSAKFICFAVCKKVTPVTLFSDGIAIDTLKAPGTRGAGWHGKKSKRANTIAIDDGFKDYAEMYQFFVETYDRLGSIRLDLIQW